MRLSLETFPPFSDMAGAAGSQIPSREQWIIILSRADMYLKVFASHVTDSSGNWEANAVDFDSGELSKDFN